MNRCLLSISVTNRSESWHNSMLVFLWRISLIKELLRDKYSGQLSVLNIRKGLFWSLHDGEMSTVLCKITL